MAHTPAHAHFLQIPFCVPLLTDPKTQLHSPGSIIPKPSTEDSLFSSTHKTVSTIPHILTLYQVAATAAAASQQQQQPTPRSEPTKSNPSPSSSPEPSIPKITTLVCLSDNLNGHAHILHGGIIATLLDEVMGILLTVNLEHAHATAAHASRPATKHQHQHQQQTLPGLAAFTKNLSVRFLRPVRTPAAVVVLRAWYAGTEGRGYRVKAVLSQMKMGRDGEVEDREEECAVGEAVFVEPRAGRL